MKLNAYESCTKHDKDDECAVCKGFQENWVFNYEETYKYYLGHLRHLDVYNYCENGKIEPYKNFVRCCQYNGLFGKEAQTLLWKILRDNNGFLIFTRFQFFFLVL